jgi:hypothetical protein
VIIKSYCYICNKIKKHRLNNQIFLLVLIIFTKSPALLFDYIQIIINLIEEAEIQVKVIKNKNIGI